MLLKKGINGKWVNCLEVKNTILKIYKNSHAVREHGNFATRPKNVYPCYFLSIIVPDDSFYIEFNGMNYDVSFNVCI